MSFLLLSGSFGSTVTVLKIVKYSVSREGFEEGKSEAGLSWQTPRAAVWGDSAMRSAWDAALCNSTQLKADRDEFCHCFLLPWECMSSAAGAMVVFSVGVLKENRNGGR